MVRNYVLLAAIFLSLSLKAQQLPMFTQYQDNLTLINPAAVNSDYLAFEQNVSFSGKYRSQWTGLDGNPTTSIFSGDYTSTNGNGFNVTTGGSLFSDKTGPTGFSGLYGRVGGVISGDPYYGGISIGLMAGFVQYGVDPSLITLADEGDVIGQNEYTQWAPDVGAGVFAYKRLDYRGLLDDSYIFAGVSIPQVLGLDLSFKGNEGTFNIARVRHIYGTLGFYKFLKDNSYIQPTVWIRYAENVPTSVDFNLRYQLPENFWIGAGAALSGNFHVEAGIIIGEPGYDNIMRIGYGYGTSFADFGPNAGSVHEINVVYSLEQ